MSYLAGDTLFAGEAAAYTGISRRFLLAAGNAPKFFLETSLESIAALEQVDCRHMCYGHFGLTSHPAQASQGLSSAAAVVGDAITKLTRMPDTPDPVQHCWLEILIKKDPLLSYWPRFSRPEQQRELSFMANSVRGFLGYLQKFTVLIRFPAGRDSARNPLQQFYPI